MFILLYYTIYGMLAEHLLTRSVWSSNGVDTQTLYKENNSDYD